ncbi:hypothetical protein HAX54_040818 [Datura stramonium]|uniref:DUF4283 domain-containing protein n=1 Tax=Datura stramonium TaxID=4076 RepID=A0ABS8SKR7_DATST|nr:hypothetical protein [Datura stramonium]
MSRETSSFFSLESRKRENMSFMEALAWPALDLGGRCRKESSKEPSFSLSEEHILKRKSFLNSCLVGSFVKWVGSPKANRNWATEEWGVGDLCRGFVNVICSLHDLSSVRILVRKGGKVPISIVVEDGVSRYKVWLSIEFRPSILQDDREGNIESGRRRGSDVPIGVGAALQELQQIKSFVSGREVIHGPDPQNLTRVEHGKSPSWVGEKFLKFGEVLGVYFEGKEERVLDLLRDIEKEANGIREKERYDPREGMKMSSRKANEGEGIVVVYPRRGRSKGRINSLQKRK